jgi:hypothetical protein
VGTAHGIVGENQGRIMNLVDAGKQAQTTMLEITPEHRKL